MMEVKKMIATVTLNAAIDKTYYLDHFEYAKVSRIQRMHAVPGGKGINVARVIHQLGGDVISTGFIGGKNGEFIENELKKQGIPHDFIKVDGESRLCLNVINHSNHTSTELLEPGPTLNDESLEEMKNHIRDISRNSKIIVLSGSLPLGVSLSYYAELIQISKKEGARVFLDTSSDALLRGIHAKPFLIKPNQDEVKKISNTEFDERTLNDKIMELMMQGISSVVVSLGSQGSIAGYSGRLFRIKAPLIEAVNTVGCGDSFIAGMAFACDRGDDIEVCFRLATAVGTANALTYEAGHIRIEDVKRLLPQVEMQQII
jgi:tagatose 6-phosphate kinase